MAVINYFCLFERRDTVKRILLLLFLGCIIFMACSCSNTNNKNESNGDIITKNGVRYKKYSHTSEVDLENKLGTILDFEISEDLAAEIGDCILKSAYSKVDFSDTELVLFKNRNRDIFTVSRWPAYDDQTYGGGGEYNVAISKADGKILKIWMDE